jgi:hypothetical protein
MGGKNLVGLSKAARAELGSRSATRSTPRSSSMPTIA